MAEETVWLWSPNEAASIGVGDSRGQRQYQVEDNLVEVAFGDAVELVKHVEVESRFGGRFQIPREVYRKATSAEIDAYVSKHPEAAARRREHLVAKHEATKAELEQRIAAMEAEKQQLEALIAATPEEDDEPKGKRK